MDHLIDPIFQEVNILFVLSFDDNAQWTSYNQYLLPTVEIKDYNFMIDGKKILSTNKK